MWLDNPPRFLDKRFAQDGVPQKLTSTESFGEAAGFLLSSTQLLRAARGAGYRLHDRAAKSPLL